MLRNHIPRRGKNAPPIDVIRGTVIYTWVQFERHYAGHITHRDYLTEVDGEIVARCELTRYDDDRRGWEQHWRVRREIRHGR